MFAARLQLQAGFLPDMLLHQTQNKIRSKTGILRGFSPQLLPRLTLLQFIPMGFGWLSKYNKLIYGKQTQLMKSH